MIAKKSLFTLLLILLVSCGRMATPLPQATSAPITLPPTWTPTIPTPIPSATEYPTFTPVPAFTPMSTPTKNPLDVLSQRFQDSLFSPSGNWVAYRDPEKLRVVSTSDSLHTFTLPCDLFKDCATVYPVSWLNGHILYFGPAPKEGGAPDGISMLSALAMIDTRTGKWDMVLPDSDSHYDFTFSPDNALLAYTQSSGAEVGEPTSIVGVLSTIDKQQPHQEHKMHVAYAGNIVWSPFKSRFVFVTVDPEKVSGVA